MSTIRSRSPLDATALTGWYRKAARSLPWRAPDAGAWAVLVSEVMLQQTPVSRVLPVYSAWLERWPSPRACATASPAEVLLAWGRLGYPRRALRLREAAIACEQRHDGEVPRDVEDLRMLPGVGTYTAAAIAAFAYRQAVPVVDINVKRVLARAVRGQDDRRPTTAADAKELSAFLPADDPALWSVALMELGALLCTARAPKCAPCPIRTDCAWLASGAPTWDGPSRPPQGYAGTDRQVRGRLLDVLRTGRPVASAAELDAVWDEPEQRGRALASLLADGLLAKVPGGYALPT